MVVARILAVLLGVGLVGWVLDAAVRNFLLPRPTKVKMTHWLAKWGPGGLLGRLASRQDDYHRRDRLSAPRPVITLLTFQVAWLSLVFTGFALIYWGTGTALSEAFDLSGSALFTLGFATPEDAVPLALVYAEALTGLTLLAMLISYLPTIYAAFQRREFMVAKLVVRTGTRTTPWGALMDSHRTESEGLLDDMWADWEDWFVDLAETHTSLTILSFYRSPEGRNHWINTARTVLDMASLRIAVVARPEPIQAHIALRSGTIALRSLAQHLGMDVPSDPQPADPISVTQDQFRAACALMQEAGIELEGDPDQAWRDFAGWRVNYDAIVAQLGEFLAAPPDPWGSLTEPDRVNTPHTSEDEAALADELLDGDSDHGDHGANAVEDTDRAGEPSSTPSI